MLRPCYSALSVIDEASVAADGLSVKTWIFEVTRILALSFIADIQPLFNLISTRPVMQVLQKYWRDSAYDIHRIIKAKDIPISRGWPAEMFGAFLSYFTRQELLDSYHGEALMDLLQGGGDPKPYVILDDDLGVKRIANMLRMPTHEAEKLVPMFINAFKKLAPGQVFRDENEFIDTIVEPRVIDALRSSGTVLSAYSAMEANHIRFEPDTWEDTDELYRHLPRGVPMDPEDIIELRKLRDDKTDTWTYRQMFHMHPADESGKVLNQKFASFCTVRVDFEKLDRAILAAGEYSVNVYGRVARAWSGGGPFDPISDPDTDISIVF
jgi:hypothetical protein